MLAASLAGRLMLAALMAVGVPLCLCSQNDAAHTTAPAAAKPCHGDGGGAPTRPTPATRPTPPTRPPVPGHGAPGPGSDESVCGCPASKAVLEKADVRPGTDLDGPVAVIPLPTPAFAASWPMPGTLSVARAGTTVRPVTALLYLHCALIV